VLRLLIKLFIIINLDTHQKTFKMKRDYFLPLLPPFFDYPGNHKGDDGTSGGPGIFIIKTLFRLTEYHVDYEMNKIPCKGLMETLKNFQRANKINPDGNFGQETRIAISTQYGLELDQIPREMIEGHDIALQPNGDSLLWANDH